MVADDCFAADSIGPLVIIPAAAVATFESFQALDDECQLVCLESNQTVCRFGSTAAERHVQPLTDDCY
jgi:hypothetical protein